MGLLRRQPLSAIYCIQIRLQLTVVSIVEDYSLACSSPFIESCSGNYINLFHPFLLVDFYMLYLCFGSMVHTFNYLNVKNTTLSNGYLGSRNDEERSEMRYVMRIAEFSESSNL